MQSSMLASGESWGVGESDEGENSSCKTLAQTLSWKYFESALKKGLAEELVQGARATAFSPLVHLVW